MIAYFDRQGRATAFCEDGKSIYFWDGRPAAYFDGDVVVSYPGRLVGWCQDGWIIDAQGDGLLFESDAIRGPAKPERVAKTAPAPRQANPVRVARIAGTTSTRPIQSASWSDRTFAQLL